MNELLAAIFMNRKFSSRWKREYIYIYFFIFSIYILYSIKNKEKIEILDFSLFI